MKKTTLTVVAFAAVALSSCSSGETKYTPVDIDYSTPAPEQAHVLSDLTASQFAGYLAKVDPQAPWHWLVDPSGIGVADSTVTVPLHDQARGDAVLVCEAARKAVRAMKFEPMAVTVESAATGVPLALSNPQSKFDKGCRTPASNVGGE